MSRFTYISPFRLFLVVYIAIFGTHLHILIKLLRSATLSLEALYFKSTLVSSIDPHRTKGQLTRGLQFLYTRNFRKTIPLAEGTQYFLFFLFKLCYYRSQFSTYNVFHIHHIDVESNHDPTHLSHFFLDNLYKSSQQYHCIHFTWCRA